MSRFRTGKPEAGGGDFSAYTLLSDMEKEALCRSLLEEFGVTNITQRGPELVCSCPLPWGLHTNGDRKPSFQLNYQKLTSMCWTCGGGGLLWLIATCRDVSTLQAHSWLQSRVGESDDDPEALKSLLAYIDSLFDPAREQAPPLPKISPDVLQPWKLIHPLLVDRGVPTETIMAQHVGYNPDIDRIVIPHFWRGDLVGWQTRQIIKDGSPKYKSTPDFPKNETVYHLPEGHDRVVVVESPMSVLRHLHHVPDLCATFGAVVTDRQARLLAGYDQVVIWMDPDGAGWRSTESLIERLEPYTTVWVVNSPFKVDVADLDDATVDCLLAEDLIPASLWSRPRADLLVSPEAMR